MNRVTKDKIELICYQADDISYEHYNGKFALTSPLKFIPFNLIFNEEEITNIIEMLLRENPHLKITIEKVGDVE